MTGSVKSPVVRLSNNFKLFKLYLREVLVDLPFRPAADVEELMLDTLEAIGVDVRMMEETGIERIADQRPAVKQLAEDGGAR
jgi:hypothetical protein